jgi:hypothetical protein
MHQYKENLYLGSKNGSLRVYDGSTVSVVKQFTSQVGKIYSDNSLLYVIPDNSKKIEIYDGKTFLEISV